MKKTIIVLLALVMVLSLVACSGTKAPEPTPEPTKDPNIIELTTDNYKKYLKPWRHLQNFSADCEYYHETANNTLIDLGNGHGTYYVFSGMEIYMEVKGASPNFNYNDIVVTCRCKGTYKDINGLKGPVGNAVDFSVDVDLELDVGGQGSKIVHYELPSGHYTYPDLIDCDIEIVEISGTVSPA